MEGLDALFSAVGPGESLITMTTDAKPAFGIQRTIAKAAAQNVMNHGVGGLSNMHDVGLSGAAVAGGARTTMGLARLTDDEIKQFSSTPNESSSGGRAGIMAAAGLMAATGVHSAKNVHSSASSGAAAPTPREGKEHLPEKTPRTRQAQPETHSLESTDLMSFKERVPAWPVHQNEAYSVPEVLRIEQTPKARQRQSGPHSPEPAGLMYLDESLHATGLMAATGVHSSASSGAAATTPRAEAIEHLPEKTQRTRQTQPETHSPESTDLRSFKESVPAWPVHQNEAHSVQEALRIEQTPKARQRQSGSHRAELAGLMYFDESLHGRTFYQNKGHSVQEMPGIRERGGAVGLPVLLGAGSIPSFTESQGLKCNAPLPRLDIEHEDPVLTGIMQKFYAATEEREDRGKYFTYIKVDPRHYSSLLESFYGMKRKLPDAFAAICGKGFGMVVCLGESSAGKTTVSGCLTGCPTEIECGNTTKQPIVYTYKRAPQFKAEIRRNTESGKAEKDFNSPEALHRFLSTSQRRISGEISDEVLHVYIEHPTCTEMVFTDLPGYISDNNEEDKKVRERVYRKFMNSPYNLYLMVHQCTSEIASVDILKEVLGDDEKYPLKMIVQTRALQLPDSQKGSSRKALSFYQSASYPSTDTKGVTSLPVPIFAVDCDIDVVESIKNIPPEARERKLADADHELLDKLNTCSKQTIRDGRKLEDIDGYRLIPGAVGMASLAKTVTWTNATILEARLQSLLPEIDKLQSQLTTQQEIAEEAFCHNLKACGHLQGVVLETQRFLSRVKRLPAYLRFKEDFRSELALKTLGPLGLYQEIIGRKIRGNAGVLFEVCQRIVENDEKTVAEGDSTERGAASLEKGGENNLKQFDPVASAFNRQVCLVGSKLDECSVDNNDWEPTKSTRHINIATAALKYKEYLHEENIRPAKDMMIRAFHDIIDDLSKDKFFVDEFLKLGIKESLLENMFSNVRVKCEKHIEEMFQELQGELRGLATSLDTKDAKTMISAYQHFCDSFERPEKSGFSLKSMSFESFRKFCSKHPSKISLAAKLTLCFVMAGAATATVVTTAGAALPVAAVGVAAASGKSKGVRKALGSFVSSLTTAASKGGKKIRTEAAAAKQKDKDRAADLKSLNEYAIRTVRGNEEEQIDNPFINYSDPDLLMAWTEIEALDFYHWFGETVSQGKCKGAINFMREQLIHEGITCIKDQVLHPLDHEGTPICDIEKNKNTLSELETMRRENYKAKT